MRYFFFILSFFFSCQIFAGTAATTENEPSAFVNGVNVITGDLYLLEHDLTVQGAEPIPLQRTYVSQKGDGYWNMFSYHRAFVDYRNNMIEIVEPSGGKLFYQWKTKHNRKGKEERKFYSIDPNEENSKGISNTSKGKPSGKTNLKNQTIHFGSDDTRLSVTCPDGTRRVYVKESFYEVKEFMDWNTSSLPSSTSFLLVKEELPNGRQIRYEWPKDKKDVWEIKTCDKEKKYVYSWVKFYPHNGKNPKTGKKDISHGDYGVETSDGRHMEFSFFTHNKVHQLKEVSQSEKPKQTYQYLSYGNKKLLKSVLAEEGRFVNINYYTPGHNLNEKDESCFRVKELIAPVGDQGTAVTTHRFSYDLNNKKTTVLDCYDIPTDYYWNDDLRLTQINRFLKPGVLFSQERFIWGSNESRDASNLLCRIILDANETPISAIRYFYDSKGNVEREVFYGNLTGKASSFRLNDQGFPVEETEHYSKSFTYSDDGKNLLLSEEEDSGLSISYTYLQNTNLMTSKVFYAHGVPQKEKRYTYDSENGILTQESTKDLKGNLHVILQIFPKSGFKVEKEKSEYRYPKLPSKVEEYHGDGNLISETKLTYTVGGKLASKQIYANSPQKQDLRFSQYDYYKGNMISETDFFGNRSESTYDKFNNLSSFKDFGGRSIVRFQYDLAGRPFFSEEEGEGLRRIIFCKYDNRGYKTEAYDSFNNKTAYEYDPFGHETKIYLPCGGVISAEYDALGNQTLLRDPKGSIRRTFYNAYNKPIQVLYPDGTSEQFFYFLNGTLASYIDQEGMQTDFTYDVFERLLSKKNPFSEEKVTYDSFNVLTEIDAEGRVTSYEYDAGGRKILEKKGSEMIRYSYDRLGRVHHTIFGDLSLIIEHSPLDQVVQERKLDSKGNLLEITDYKYDASRNLISSKKYIEGNEVEEIREYDAFKRIKLQKDALGAVTSYEYDEYAHKQTIKDPLGSQIIQTFNAENKIISLERISAQGNLLLQELYFYDSNQNLIEKQMISAGNSQKMHWEYDEMNRVTSLIEAASSPLEKITRYSYNPKGLLSQTIKPSGILLTNIYSPLGYLNRQFSSDGTIDYTNIYDLTGLITESIDAVSGANFSRAYTEQGRLEEENISSLSFKNSYDVQGRRNLLKLPDHSFISYEYDALRLNSVSKIKKGKSLYTHRYLTYDLSGHLLHEMPIHNLTPIAHKYDNLGRHVEIQSAYFNEKFRAFDLAGNLLEKKRNGELFSFTYDELYQLTSETKHTYEYDFFQNRIGKDGTRASSNDLNQTSELNYNKDGTPLSYEGKTLKYDALDRLILVEDSLKKITYSYDSFHRRLSKKILDKDNAILEDLSYLYDDQKEIGTFDHRSQQIIELRVLGKTPRAEIGSAIALELYGKTYMPIHDLQGNIATLVLIQDESLEHFSYTAFGEEENPSFNPWRFSSKRVDPETGFIFFGRRHYLPKLGRWLTPDPLGLEAGPNLYTFLSNSPLIRFDLYGLTDWGHNVEEIAYQPDRYRVMGVWQETPKNHPAGTFSIGPKEGNDYHIFFVNGIRTLLGEAVDYAKMVSKYGSGAKVQGIYNNTKGLFDIASASAGLFGLRRAPSDLLEEQARHFLDHCPNPKKKALIVCHSDGATHVYEFLKKLSSDQQQRFVVLAIAPATVIPDAMCFKSDNFASRDIIPKIRPVVSWIKHTLHLMGQTDHQEGLLPSLPIDNLNELQYIEPIPKWSPFVHSFSNPTFSETLEDLISNHVLIQGIYE